MDVAGAVMLVQSVRDKNVSFTGIQPLQASADFSYQNLLPPDAILLASDLSKAGISGSLTRLNLSCNL